MIQKRSEKCAAASHALTLKPFTLEWKGVSGDECHSGSAPVVAPAPPPSPILRLGLWWPAATLGLRVPLRGLWSRCPSASRAATARTRHWRRPVPPCGVPAGLTSGSEARCPESCVGGSHHRLCPTTSPTGSRLRGTGSGRLILPARSLARDWAGRLALLAREGSGQAALVYLLRGAGGPAALESPVSVGATTSLGVPSSWVAESAREIARGLVYALTHGAFALRSGTTCAAIPTCPSCPACPASIQAGDLSWLILAAFALGLVIGVGLTVGAAAIAQLTRWTAKPSAATPPADRRADQLAIGGSAGLRAAVRLSQRADGGGQ